jgi:hypothetical protein
VNQAVALNQGLAGESGRDDTDGEVATLARTGVAGVRGAVVHDFEPFGRQSVTKSLLDQGDPIGHAGSTLRNG